MISIVMSDIEIDVKSALVSSASDGSPFKIASPKKSSVFESEAARTGSAVEKSDEDCLRAAESEGARVSSTVEEMEARISERGAGSVDLNAGDGNFEVGKSGVESVEVRAAVLKIKDEGSRLDCWNDNSGGGATECSVDRPEEAWVSPELGGGKIEKNTGTRVSESMAGDLHLDGGNGVTECLVGRSEARMYDIKAEGLLSGGRNGSFDGGNDGGETRVLYGGRGRSCDVEVVDGQSDHSLSSSCSVFDEVSTDENSETFGLDTVKGLSCGFENGDMVWGKVKSHPWWPGHIYNEAFASISVRRARREGHVLVAFFGDSSYGWFDLDELIPFEPNYAEKSRQTNSRNFMKSVEEAVDEVSRRSALGLTCCCRNPFNFRPASVQGYFGVDVVDYEPGGVYSGKQIKKARESFQPSETLSFVQRLALMPRDGEHSSIDWIKNVAMVLAYRRAVFEEFDETYAQAFGMEPVRPSRGASGMLEQPDKVPARAPLSGPMVIAEALGERKSSGKSVRAMDSSKKDRYLFKRRDEPNEKRVVKQEVHRMSQYQANSVSSLAFKEASNNLTSQAGDYILQKRAPAVPEKRSIPAKQEQRETVNQESGVPVPKLQQVKSPGHVNWADLQTVIAADAYGLVFATEGGSEEEKVPSESATLEDDASREMPGSTKLNEAVRTSSTITDIGRSESHGTVVGVSRAVRQEVEVVIDEDSRQKDQVMGDSRMGTPIVYPDGLFPVKVLGAPSGDVAAVKTKILKRPIGDESSDKYAMREKKKKKKNKDSGLETRPDPQQKSPKITKDRETLRKLAGKSIGIGSINRQHPVADSERKDATVTDSATPVVDVVNVDVELPQLVSDLLALALDPFHAIGRHSSAIVRHVFLKFRSLVYQKSLVLPPACESEMPESGVAKLGVGRSLRESSTGNVELASTEGEREAPATSKSLKHSSRMDDSTKMGRKRSPSDRQEEMSAKRLKKLNDLKLLAKEKKGSSQKLEGQRGEQKETGTMYPAKPTATDPVKKPELPIESPTPTALTMKFLPGTSLPSGPQLKARFARFGPLDLSGTRIYWKTYTCRVVYKQKSDALAAYNYAERNNIFGQLKVKYSVREMDSSAPESTDMSKGRVEDNPDNAPSRPSSGDVTAEPRLVLQQRLPAVHSQLKSCLKKPSGDEVGSAVGIGIAKESPRVKFLLGGEGTKGEQVVVGSSTSNNNGTSADGATSSSIAFDVNIKNTKTTVILPSPLPLPTFRNSDLLPPSPSSAHPFVHQLSHTPDSLPSMPSTIPVTPVAQENRSQFSKAPHHAQFNEVLEPRKENIVDISNQMLSLLVRCSDVVTDVKSALGYVPYHPL